MTRGQNAVHVVPLDWSAAGSVLSGLVERIDPASAVTQLVIVTADAESAAAAATAVVQVSSRRGVRVVAATASPRAARLLKLSPAHVVTGAPSELVALVQGSALKPQDVRGVLFAWLDSILETPDAQPLETLLGELPKESARVVLASAITPALEALVERYARRARRAADTPADAGATALSAEYVATAGGARMVALRRLLDALDLPRAVLYARSESVREESLALARALGYPEDAVRMGMESDGPIGDPLVLVELPTSREAMRALVGDTGRRILAVVQPSQIASLRGLLAGGVVAPVALLEVTERARGRDAALRASLRDVLVTDDVRREMLALEPLLAEFDGIEIAAAALRMLEQQRPTRAASTPAHAAPMQRVFLNLGDKDGIRPQEIVTAITVEAGIPGSHVGKVEVRDTHSLVEVSAVVSELVVAKMTGSVVRGRRVQARLDLPREDRPPRSGPPARGGSDRPRPFDRGDRPARGDRSERPARPFNGAPRTFDRDAGIGRPTRPRPRRDDA